MENKTPLYDRHVSLGGRMIPFAGWLLPERYGSGLIDEHLAVRRRAGVFDASHMGEAELSGSDALGNMQALFTNDFSKLKEGQVRYTVMCDDSGGVLDDMLVYRLAADRFFIVVNASNREGDIDWMKSHLTGNARIADLSDHTALIAVQGPASAGILGGLAEGLPAGNYTFKENVPVSGVPCMVSRTGYTGEDGFELYCEPHRAAGLWDALLSAGESHGLIPCGLGARDTLRLEAGMPLYGHEMDRSISPLETGLGFAVKMNKGDFIGKAAIIYKGKPVRKRVGVRVIGRGIARENAPVLFDGKNIGRITSGTFCPFLNYAAAMALVGADTPDAARVIVDIRGKLTEAEIVKLPFYKRGAGCNE